MIAGGKRACAEQAARARLPVGAARGDHAVIFDVQKFAVHDGPGIRTLVFFKGCPLACDWCSNPESQQTKPELMLYSHRCIGCGRCVEVCPTGEHLVGGQRPVGCLSCGQCAAVCPARARVIVGRSVTVEDVMAEIRRDTVFYQNSCGGVTVGGGEALIWSEFVVRLLAACKAEGMSTALETCGGVPWRNLDAAATYLDLVLYDVKHLDSDKHARHTGVRNQLILANLERLARRGGVGIIVRVPVVPGFNDDLPAMHAITRFLSEKKITARIDLLPYHRFAQGKYMLLGREYPAEGTEPPSPETMESLANIGRELGLDVRVGG